MASPSHNRGRLRSGSVIFKTLRRMPITVTRLTTASRCLRRRCRSWWRTTRSLLARGSTRASFRLLGREMFRPKRAGSQVRGVGNRQSAAVPNQMSQTACSGCLRAWEGPRGASGGSQTCRRRPANWEVRRGRDPERASWLTAKPCGPKTARCTTRPCRTTRRASCRTKCPRSFSRELKSTSSSLATASCKLSAASMGLTEAEAPSSTRVLSRAGAQAVPSTISTGPSSRMRTASSIPTPALRSCNRAITTPTTALRLRRAIPGQ